MTVDDGFQRQLDGIREMVIGFANSGMLRREHLFGSQQRLALETITRALGSSDPVAVLKSSHRLRETLVACTNEL